MSCLSFSVESKESIFSQLNLNQSRVIPYIPLYEALETYKLDKEGREESNDFEIAYSMFGDVVCEVKRGYVYCYATPYVKSVLQKLHIPATFTDKTKTILKFNRVFI